jgi:hypothetical protein
MSSYGLSRKEQREIEWSVVEAEVAAGRDVEDMMFWFIRPSAQAFVAEAKRRAREWGLGDES